MIEYYDKKTDKRVAFFFVEAEKAFDNVNWEFMKALIKKLNLGHKFGNVIEAIYSHQTMTLLINNNTSKPIMIQKGTRQGCPLSPLLFILFLETLLKQVQKDPKIKGLQIKSHTYKYRAFADDIVCGGETGRDSTLFVR